jgi:multiple sugar transport system substrate-binding protein
MAGAHGMGGATALLLNACAPGPTNAAPAKELKGTARVSINASQPLVDAVTQLSNQVRGTHPGVTVEVENIVTASGAGGGWFDKLIVQAAGDSMPDVMAFEDLRGIPAAAEGITRPLDPFLKSGGIALKDFDPIAVRDFTFGGKQFGIPWRWDVNLLFVNRDLLNTAGVPFPANDWTLDQFVDVLRKVSQPVASPPVFGYDPRWSSASGGTQIIFWGLFGNDYLNPGRTKSLLREASSERALEFLLDLVRRWHVAPDYLKNEQQGVAFPTGNVAFALRGSGGIVGYRPGGGSPLPFAWDVMPMPKGPGRAFTGGDGSAWYLSASTKVPDLGWELVKTFSTREAHVQIGQLGTASARPEVARLPQLRPADLPPRNWAGFDAAVGAAVPFPLSASFLKWRDPAAAIIWEVFDGKRGPKDALAAAADLIDMELAKERRA